MEMSRVGDVRCRDKDCSVTLVGKASEVEAFSMVSPPETHPVATTIDLQDGHVVVYSKAALPPELRPCLLKIQGQVVPLYGPTKSGGDGRRYEPIRKSGLLVERWACAV